MGADLCFYLAIVCVMCGSLLGGQTDWAGSIVDVIKEAAGG
jgi:hypothetical protein